MATIQGVGQGNKTIQVSDAGQAALKDASVKKAVDKVAEGIKNGASADTIAKDKADAFAKYKAAGGQATNAADFGAEASSLSAQETSALRKAFDLDSGTAAAGGSSGRGTGNTAGSSTAPTGSLANAGTSTGPAGSLANAGTSGP